MDQFAPSRQDRDDGDLRPDEHDILTLAPADEGEGDGRDEGSKPGMPSRWIFVGVALVLALALAWGIYRHVKTGAAATATQQRQADMVPEVRVVAARTEDGPVELTLPGETQPFATANIYARATGYITERRVDIGSRVKKGDLLVHISAPDLDQQLESAVATLGQVEAALLQANANVSQSEANLNLAKVNLQRAQALVGKGFETLQNRDQLQANQIAQGANLDAARAGVKVAEANVKAQQANIDRLRALTAFEDVRAPFDGVVTVRNVDLGTLVNADTASGTPMFTVDEDDVLRVLVQVPQNSSLGVRDGLQARITVPQMPGRTFVGKVTRQSSALQSTARTLTVEVDVPNQAGVLRSGLYAYVTLDIPRIHPDVVLPAETLIFDQGGTRVAVVGEGDKVRMVPVNIRRDFGTSLEVDQGPKGGDRVVLSPPATLKEGARVEVKAEVEGEAPPKPTGTPDMSGVPPAPVPGGEGAGGVGQASGE
ncbi:efflux RND transporter periplasmic adaptor subunit [Lichenibacterium dinghuense]|uniref:efflux RND transporter periplasmic adaptor subunit n=1 Tax=Lichenibacterium dinghuense TaxID=2895977 RepID=UPI001F00E27B|nr:efflux RND transporter periplasmic adaptor subunit [Lichenibacterium sp. 6Y81]